MPQCSEVPIALYTRGYVLSASYIFPYLSPCEPRSSRTRDVARRSVPLPDRRARADETGAASATSPGARRAPELCPGCVASRLIFLSFPVPEDTGRDPDTCGGRPARKSRRAGRSRRRSYVCGRVNSSPRPVLPYAVYAYTDVRHDLTIGPFVIPTVCLVP